MAFPAEDIHILMKLQKKKEEPHGKTGAAKGVQKYRDVIKRWRGGTDLTVLACESQEKIHYAMPVRNMLYDTLTYTEQIRQIWKGHNNKRNSRYSVC